MQHTNNKIDYKFHGMKNILKQIMKNYISLVKATLYGY